MSQHKKKILLVDDDADFRRATRKILDTGGYDVVEAENGVEGLEKAVSEKPDLILIDIVMDTFSEGFDLISRLAAHEDTGGIPRIIISTLNLVNQLDTIHPQEVGTLKIIQKPVGAEDLIQAIESAFHC